MSVPTIDTENQTQSTPETPAGGKLLLDSLEITNFRAFKHLTIPKLGRVNLITGKNNVGKTTLLEAIYTYAHKARPSILKSILERRNELGEPLRFAGLTGFVSAISQSEADWTPYSGALFHNRNTIFQYDGPFIIRPIDKENAELRISINFYLTREDGSVDTTPLIGNEGLQTLLKAQPYLSIKATWLPESLVPLNTFFFGTTYWSRADSDFHMRCEFISGEDSEDEKRWQIAKLNSMTEEVISSLHIIDKEITDIDFFMQGGDNLRRIPMVKRKGGNEFVPLKRMGDGMNRLLRIAVGLTICRDGILLLDEIENGLHYSIQPKIWSFIFQVARQLNVQVFATTHSWDCIEAFQQAASEDDDPGNGVLVRLLNKDGESFATVFDEEDLAEVTKNGIEVR